MGFIIAFLVEFGPALVIYGAMSGRFGAVVIGLGMIGLAYEIMRHAPERPIRHHH